MPPENHEREKAKSEPRASEAFEIAAILEQARSGDRIARDVLWKLCEKYLLLIANQDLDPAMLQKFGASDMVQQSLIVAEQKIADFNGESKPEFFAWMRQILHNECRQTVRSYRQTQKRSVHRELGLERVDSATQPLLVKDDHLTPSSEAIQQEQLRLVNEALGQLSKLEQQVIMMRNWHDLSFAEIGKTHNKSSEAVRKIWSRAILKLEAVLQKLNAL